MRSLTELLQSPRALKVMVVGGSVLALVLMGLLLAPTIVRGKLQREARARGFEAEVDTVRLGLGRVLVRGVRLTSPGDDFELRLEVVAVGLFSTEVRASGGTLRGSGDPERILRKLRGASASSQTDGGAAGSGRDLSLDGLYAQWRQGQARAEVFGARASRRAGLVSLGADLARAGDGGRSVEARGVALGIANAGGHRRLVRLETSALELTLRGAAPATAPATGANGQGAEGAEEAAEGAARAEKLRALRALVLPMLRDGLAAGASLTLNGVAARVQRGAETLSFGPSQLLLSRDEDTLRVSLAPSTTEPGATPMALSLELPLTPAALHLRARGGPVSLSSLGVQAGQLGLRDVKHATLAADGAVSFSEDFETLELDGKLALNGLTLQRPELSPQPVGPWSFDVRLKARARLDGSEVRVLSSEAHWGDLRAELSGIVATVAGNRQVEGRVRVPLSGCQSVLDAMPHGLLPLVKGMKLGGSFGVDLQVRYDQTKPSDTRVSLAVKNECRVQEVPSELSARRFERPFLREVKGPDGSAVTIEGGPGTQSWVSIDDISRHMESAVLVCEDAGFHSHAGFDFRALESAIKDDLKQGRFARGGSTVSMQLAKNLYLGTEKTLGRKLQEALLTLLLEQQLDKRRILELYLNVVELGPGLYGVGDAAHYYFATPARSLTLGQSLYLASLLPNPTHSRFGPDGKLNAGWSNYLRKLMRIAHKRKRIDDAELEAGLAEEIAFRVPGSPTPPADATSAEPPYPPELDADP